MIWVQDKPQAGAAIDGYAGIGRYGARTEYQPSAQSLSVPTEKCACDLP